MTLTIELPPEVEALYTSEARITGVTLEALLQERLIAHASPAIVKALAPEERVSALLQWAATHPVTPLLSEEAMSRRFLYHQRP
ncbi:MAG: hypothetical protein H7039_07920 [Bryobacteraceae bacterium]|nr:hypothetical protein [Bryobacteraceae bacterium]